MKHVLTIPHWNPALLNQLMKNRWEESRLKKADSEIVWAIARQERIPIAGGKRRVSIHITLPRKRGRKPDPDAFLKSALDALVKCGMLKDDSDKWCEWTKPTIETGTQDVWGTRITLEDL